MSDETVVLTWRWRRICLNTLIRETGDSPRSPCSADHRVRADRSKYATEGSKSLPAAERLPENSTRTAGELEIVRLHADSWSRGDEYGRCV